MWHDLIRGYQRHIVRPHKEGEFLVLVAFLLTFVTVRLITRAIRAGRGPFRNIKIRGWHMHHLVPGITLLLVTGYLAVAVDSEAGRRTVAILFGVGAALTLDEFALWIHLRDVYWEKEGRRSVDAVIVAAVIGGLVLIGREFWADLLHTLARVL